MSAPTNTTTTLVSIGNREDLENVIYRVAPEDVPFSTNIGTDKAKAITHDWQTQALANANADNAQLEGDDVSSLDAPNLTARVKNICQIFRKTAGVSESQEAVDSAGRDSDMGLQEIMKGLELKRDMEAAFLRNGASQLESGGTPRKTAGALAWITSNTSVGAGGSNGGYSGGLVSAATNGTLRTFTEAQLKAAMSSCFTNGGKPNQVYMGPTQKQEFSAFTGIASIRKEAPNKGLATIVAGAEIYLSDFGELMAIPHAYGLTRDVLGIDPKYWAAGTLRPTKSVPLAKTGDSDRKKITAEKCLISRNEKSSFAIRDLQ